MIDPKDTTAAPWPAEVLAHLAWLQRLCRALVAAPEEADDIAQETVRRALDRPGPVRDVRRYLAGVARNVRREGRRTAARDRDLRRSVEERTESPEDHRHEHLELLRLVLAEVDRLPDAQRRAVYAVYVEGLGPSAVAARDGGAASSVRSNVARGLERIRERLDRAHGSRAAWTAALGPWAVRAEGAAASATAPSHAASPVLPEAAAAGLLGSLSIAMLVKLLAGAAALAALVFFLDPLGAREDRAQRVDDLGAVAKTDGPGRSPAVGAPLELEQPEAFEPARSAASGAHAPAPRSAVADVPGHVPEARFVDAETGEPVPGMALRIETLLRIRPAQDGLAPTPLDGLKSGADGHVAFDAIRLDAGQHSAQYSDDWGMSPAARMWWPRAITVPGPNEIEVTVGPTFTVAPNALERARGAEFDVTVRGPGVGVARRPQARLLEAAGRSGRFRFTEPFGRPRHAGPWTLEFRSFDGLWAAEHVVDRRVGVEPNPLDVAFERCGTILFTLDAENGARAPLVTVQVTGPDGAALRSVQLRRPGWADGLSNGTSADAQRPRAEALSHLAPGTYRWSCELDGARTGGEVEVEPGETSRVLIEIDGGQAPERFVPVVVETSGAPDLTNWHAQFYSASGGLETIGGQLERDPESPGDWRIPVDALPAGSWNCVMLAGDGYRVEPRSVSVPLKGPIPALRILALEQVTVSLSVDVAAEFASSVVVYHADGVIHSGVARGDDGRYSCQVPADHPTAFYVSLTGHSLGKAVVDPGRTPSELTVRLEEGTRTRALVLDAEQFGPRAGVEVTANGRSIGRTDEWGEIWFEPEGGVVESVALAPDELERFRLIASPRDGMSTEHGYSLVVAAK
ncbi:MAG: RNA polymerase sigma factor [Planctomycetota bacterium]